MFLAEIKNLIDVSVMMTTCVKLVEVKVYVLNFRSYYCYRIL